MCIHIYFWVNLCQSHFPRYSKPLLKASLLNTCSFRYVVLKCTKMKGNIKSCNCFNKIKLQRTPFLFPYWIYMNLSNISHFWGSFLHSASHFCLHASLYFPDPFLLRIFYMRDLHCIAIITTQTLLILHAKLSTQPASIMYRLTMLSNAYNRIRRTFCRFAVLYLFIV